ncbi:MAG: efflux RND transporter periplasmic adaptor subunit [Polyangiaceae bacterium]
MKKALFWIVPLLVALAGGAAYFKYAATPTAPEIEYKTAAVEKRRIVGRITASGTLQAVVTVQVGAQVSGRIQSLFADFNSQVKKGDLIAKIDPQLFQAAVAQASANYRAARASVAQANAKSLDAERQYKRTKDLNEQGLASQLDVDTAQTNAAVAAAQVDSAKASVDQALAQLNQAKVNLSYTDIHSPIDGVVISRSVDVGQTVAASLSAPVIFTIAEDLRKMQVNTSISEGDVGRIETGMPGFFTVDAFPGQRFKGTIGQIRNAAQTVQNVVTYNALIDVANDDLKLRPGMTANTTIIYAQKDDVVAVPNQALRFRPPPEMLPSASASAGTAAGSAGTAAGAAGTAAGSDAPSGTGRGRGNGGGSWGGGARPAGAGMGRDGGDTANKTIYVLRDGKPQAITIQTGLTDGTNTELTGGDLHEGDQVILDANVKGGSTTTTTPAGNSPAGGGQRLRF